MKSNKNWQKFLNGFFDNEKGHEIKEINGFILEKQIHGVTGKPIVAVYTKESWARKEIGRQFSLNIPVDNSY